MGGQAGGGRGGLSASFLRLVVQHELEVGAVGVPDPRSGEAIKIVVVRKDPELTAGALIEHCRKNLTGYKVPRHVEFRAALPRSNVGKILRRTLREPAAGG